MDGDSWSKCCSGSALFVFNGVDLVCGVALIVYSLYIGLNGYAPEWLYMPIVVVGSLLLLSVLMSWCGASNQSCSMCLSCSSYLLILLSLAELALGVVILTQGSSIDRFLQQHQQELHLTDDQLHRLENYKFIPAYGLLALFMMEVLRFCCSSGLYRLRRKRTFQVNMQCSRTSTRKNTSLGKLDVNENSKQTDAIYMESE
ncbi:unnamed protein product [Peronospora farinosa]|uniref:Uncharacterized protein n=1 Tax=Peronospora farinosa TaxID=134698 RepID=A0AAV0SU55_9STRA|nr:unnamed protein product [Peronospora farinosa]CAI5706200.1 unnamed protein product [Peronospora farinosa]